MERSLYRVVMAVVVMFLGTQAASRGDFEWNQAEGPPDQKTSSSCTVLPDCVADGCTNTNVVLKINGVDTTVKSYKKVSVFIHGNCENLPKSSATCLQYPQNSRKCADVGIYGLDNCGTLLARWYVFSGNCDLNP